MTLEHSERLIACRHCDRLHLLEDLARGQSARCSQCDGPLFRGRPTSLQHTLAFTLTAAILFVIANSAPLLTFELEGRSQQAHLVSGAIALYHDGMWELAALSCSPGYWPRPCRSSACSTC